MLLTHPHALASLDLDREAYAPRLRLSLQPRQAGPMWDIVRDATVGQVLNRLSRGKLLPYPDQRPGYEIPERYLVKQPAEPSSPSIESQRPCDGATLVDTSGVQTPVDLEKFDSEKKPSPVDAFNPYLVDWDGPDDQDNPKYAPAG